MLTHLNLTRPHPRTSWCRSFSKHHPIHLRITKIRGFIKVRGTMSKSDVPASDSDFINFPSRRSTVHSTQGIVACTQPLACQAGIKVLEAGGNAADAAVAVAAALGVTEPSSGGIGGDVFALFYDAQTKKVSGLNGSGRSPKAMTRELAEQNGLKGRSRIPPLSVYAITVPGAPAAFIDVIERFGNKKLSMQDILAPAIQLAEEGFPVSEISAKTWENKQDMLLDQSPNGQELLIGGRAPAPGHIMKMPGLAKVMRHLGTSGKKAFYEGGVAEAMVKVCKDKGGVLTLEDLKTHESTLVEPISIHLDKLGLDLWECPPNGQGIVALMAMGIIEALEKSGKIPPLESLEHNSAEYAHIIIESLRIAFADGQWFVTDPDVENVPAKKLLDKTYLAERAKLFNPDKIATHIGHGSPALSSSDTVYFAVTDKWGNGCSFIMSIYDQFGSGLVPKGCGFVLQNRGANFNLQEGHPNVVKPSKRPYHTIIPAMITSNGKLRCVYGVMGGFMQPQGHVQVLLNMYRFKMHEQAALDAPRICIGGFKASPGLFLEDGISEETMEGLRKRGHSDVSIVRGYERGVFGRGQVIRVHYQEGRRIYSAGSDPRGDGMAVPLL